MFPPGNAPSSSGWTGVPSPGLGTGPAVVWTRAFSSSDPWSGPPGPQIQPLRRNSHSSSRQTPAITASTTKYPKRQCSSGMNAKFMP